MAGVNVDELLGQLTEAQKAANNIKSTLSVPVAERQFQREVVNTGQVQQVAQQVGVEVALDAARVQSDLRLAQAAADVDYAQGVIQVEDMHREQVAGIVQAKDIAAQNIATEGNKLNEIAMNDTKNPLMYIYNRVRASFIEQDLADSVAAYNAQDALLSQATEKRNNAIAQLQAKRVVLPMAIAKEEAEVALQELQQKGIAADGLFKATQINEDTAGQIAGSAGRIEAFNEAARRRAEAKAAEDAENHDGVVYLAGLYMSKQLGRFPTRAEILANKAAMANGRAIYATNLQKGDGSAGNFVIAGTKIFTEGLDQKGLSGAAVLQALAPNAPAEFMAISDELAGSGRQSRAYQAGRSVIVNAEVEAARARIAANPQYSAAQQKEILANAQKNALTRVQNMTQEEVLAEAGGKLQPRTPALTGADISGANLAVLADPAVAKKLGLPDNVAQLLTRADVQKAANDLPADSGMGLLEKSNRLLKIMQAEGIKQPEAVLAKVVTEAARIGVAREDETARSLYQAERGEYIPIRMTFNPGKLVRSESFIGSLVSPSSIPQEIRDYTTQDSVDLSDPAAFRRALQLYEKRLQFDANKAANRAAVDQRKQEAFGGLPQGMLLK